MSWVTMGRLDTLGEKKGEECTDVYKSNSSETVAFPLNTRQDSLKSRFLARWSWRSLYFMCLLQSICISLEIKVDKTVQGI